jgi:DNA modification methylase
VVVKAQEIEDNYAVYNGDCCEVLPELPDESVHYTIYSPPFSDLYNYSSSERDMSNSLTYEQFLEHYEFLVEENARVMISGRLVSVHCMDLRDGSGLVDFPGDIIRLHRKHGFDYHSRHVVWKEPLRVAIRTRSQGLMHKQIVKDSSLCRMALPDYVLTFRKKGKNPEPIRHPIGLTSYVGERTVPLDLARRFRNHKNPKTNKLSHWIWQQYASAFWDDVRVDRVLPYKPAKDQDDEKHVCPLQLDVIERCLVLWTNPGDTVLTPFMGVGSEVFTAVACGRKAIGVELKENYYRQALRNLKTLRSKSQSKGLMQ